MSSIRSLAVCLSVSLLVPPAAAQLQSYSGSGTQPFLGFSVDGVGDVDLDGVPDFAYGIPRTSFFLCDWGESAVEVRSGATGALLRRFTLDVGEHHGAIVRGAGDVDADGVPDILVANSPDFDCAFDPALHVYSGASGAQLHHIHVPEWYELYEYQLDKDLAAAGDVDGDGHADFIAGATDAAQFAGRAQVFSGASGAPLLVVDGAAPSEQRGRWVAGVGDWNGDGLADVAIGSTASATQVWSPATQQVIFTTSSVGRLDDPGDFDGDGLRDLVVGSRVVSGTGAVLRDFAPFDVLRIAVDFDQDGWRDFVAGEPAFDQERGRAALLSGADGSLLLELFTGVEPGDRAGFEVAHVGDTNADGVHDVLVGVPFAGSGAAGRAMLFTGYCPPPPVSYCIAAPNSTGSGAHLGFEGSWSISSNDGRLVATSLPPNHFGLFYYGPAPATASFGNGIRCVGPPFYRLWPPVGFGSAGVAERALDFSEPPLASGPGAIVAGSTWFFQLWYRDVPAGGAFFNLSDGSRVTFCP